MSVTLRPYLLTLFILSLLSRPAQSQSTQPQSIQPQSIQAQSSQPQVVANIQAIQNAPLEIATPYTTLSSAQPAVVTLQINEPASLSVSAPLPNGFNDPVGTQRNSLLRYDGESAAAGDSLFVNFTGTIDVEVDMQVIRPQPYSPGIYRYDVLLTITPQ